MKKYLFTFHLIDLMVNTPNNPSYFGQFSFCQNHKNILHLFGVRHIYVYHIKTKILLPYIMLASAGFLLFTSGYCALQMKLYVM